MLKNTWHGSGTGQWWAWPSGLGLVKASVSGPRIRISEHAGVSLGLLLLLTILSRPPQTSLKAVYLREKVTLKLIEVWKCL